MLLEHKKREALTNHCQEAVCLLHGPEMFVGSVHVQSTKPCVTFALRDPFLEMLFEPSGLNKLSKLQGKVQIKVLDRKPLPAALKNYSLL